MERYADHKQPNLGVSHKLISNIIFPNLKEPNIRVSNFTLTHNLIPYKPVANKLLPVLIQPYLSVPHEFVSNKPFTFLIEPYFSVAHFRISSDTSSFINPPCDNASLERFSFIYPNLTLPFFLQPSYNKSNQPSSVFCTFSLSHIVPSRHNTSASKTTYWESHVT